MFGEDYPTRDGTCVRDYIQVTDLIDAHMAALAYLRRGGAAIVCNCGYGHGATVKEVIEVVKRVSGVDFKVNKVGRRPGDPAAIVARADRVREVLGWRPQRDNLDEIVRQALEWERRLHNRQASTRADDLRDAIPDFTNSPWNGLSEGINGGSGTEWSADGRR